MYGAIIGDIVGSKYEFRPIKSKDFPFISEGCTFTDDTVMTVAVAKAILKTRERCGAWFEPEPFKAVLTGEMRDLGNRYSGRGYGAMFSSWLHAGDPRPYGSYGNGAAMRVSPCAIYATTLGGALELARASAEVTHDHPEGVRGAQAVAACIYLAKTGKTKAEIRAHVENGFYKLPGSVGEVRGAYSFDETCQGSVPQAILCFLESESYEDAVRNAVSLGGDADTQAAIAGSIAWTYYRLWGDGPRKDGADDWDLWPWVYYGDDERYKDTGKRASYWPACCDELVEGYGIDLLLPSEFVEVINELDAVRAAHAGTAFRMSH